MQLPKLEDLNVKNKKVIVRADLDFDPNDTDNLRLDTLLPTLLHLAKNKSEIVIIGHRGRPHGKVDEGLSMKPVAELLEKKLAEKLGKDETEVLKMQVMENLRFNIGEEENSDEYAKELSKHGEIFINEAFGVSHRSHASIVGVPKALRNKEQDTGNKKKVAVGFRFAEEVENLSRVLDNPVGPVVIIVSGVKKDKLGHIENFKKFANKILVGGRLSVYLPEDLKDPKLIVARLVPDKEDITIRSIEKFESEIAKAGTIVVGGPVGKFEDEGHRQGTQRIFEAVAGSKAFRVAGGGETEEAISMFGLEGKFDWISTGGGAMLEFLATGTLPGIDALIN